MTESTFWLIFVVALGLPGATIGLFLRRLEKKLEIGRAHV